MASFASVTALAQRVDRELDRLDVALLNAVLMMRRIPDVGGGMGRRRCRSMSRLVDGAAGAAPAAGESTGFEVGRRHAALDDRSLGPAYRGRAREPR